MENNQNYWSFWEGRRRLSRRRVLQTGVAAGIGLAAGLPILGCTSGQPQQPAPSKVETPQAKYGGILKVGYKDGSGYLHPGGSRDGNDPNWLYIVGDALVNTAPDGSPDPEASLAASWKQEGPTTIVFNLRQGVKFHDGTDYDAPAQKAYFEYLLDANRAKTFGYRGMIETIKEMQVVDKYTLRIQLSKLDPGFLAAVGGPPGVPVSPTAIEKLGPDIMIRPAATGPFMVKSFTPGGEWVFEKNPNYWRKGLPYLDGITFFEIPDERVRGASAQAGQVDLAYFFQPGESTERLKQDPNLIVSEITAGTAVFRINHALPPLDNLKVRQAIASCIDREAILKSVYQGVGLVAKGGMMPPGNWAYTDVMDVRQKFDIARARQLIKESGVSTPVSLKLLATDGQDSLTAQLFHGWLSEAGFDVILEIYPLAEARRRMLDELTYHLHSTGASLRADPDGQFALYATSTAYYNAGRKSQDPIQKQFDDLVKAGGSTYDQKERKKAYDQLQRIMEQTVTSTINLIYKVKVEAHRRNVKGMENFWSNAMITGRPQFLWKE